MNLILYYTVVLFLALIIMILAFAWAILKRTKNNKISEEIIFHFKQDNQSKSLSDMINFHKNQSGE